MSRQFATRHNAAKWQIEKHLKEIFPARVIKCAWLRADYLRCEVFWSDSSAGMTGALYLKLNWADLANLSLKSVELED